MTQLPASYDAVSIKVAPAQLRNSSVNIETWVIDIFNEIESISSALSKLHAGWDGTSAAEAQDFSNQWTAAMTQLYGSADGSSAGLLSLVASGLLAAAGNYSAADTALTTMFGSLSTQLSAASSGDDTSPIPAGAAITDGSLSAVGEVSWTAT
jgi:uncharacterized protein YukE